MLELDPFDEAANLGLVAALAKAGRHGEARRAYNGYTARMKEIGVEPAPTPSRPSAEAPPLPEAGVSAVARTSSP